jgi:hypothetical protein
MFTKAKSSPDAMSKFFEWLKQQAVWSHLWSIEIKIEQIENGSWI